MTPLMCFLYSFHFFMLDCLLHTHNVSFVIIKFGNVGDGVPLFEISLYNYTRRDDESLLIGSDGDFLDEVSRDEALNTSSRVK